MKERKKEGRKIDELQQVKDDENIFEKQNMILKNF
jgi:hypothetical protein